MKKNEINLKIRKQVAADARKLVKGQISEVDFQLKYHQSYLDEFGIDNRPLSLKSFLTQYTDRRTLFKVGGATLLSALGIHYLSKTGLAAGIEDRVSYEDLLLGAANEQEQPAGKVQLGLVIDLERCDGCLSCVYACWNHNFNPPGVLWLHVLSFRENNETGTNFFIRLCQHCANPPCVKVCPVRARHKREKDGLVLTDYDLCIGCRYCMVTCPYGVNYFQWDTPTRENIYHKKLTDENDRWVLGNPPRGVMGKCTFCPDRQDDGRANLVCQLVCTKDVFHFGDLNDPGSEPYQYLEEKKAKNGGHLSTFRLLENHGTKPSIIYIGKQPSDSSELVEGPVSYSDWGLIEKRMEYLKKPEPWFNKVFGGKLW